MASDTRLKREPIDELFDTEIKVFFRPKISEGQASSTIVYVGEDYPVRVQVSPFDDVLQIDFVTHGSVRSTRLPVIGYVVQDHQKKAWIMHDRKGLWSCSASTGNYSLFSVIKDKHVLKVVCEDFGKKPYILVKYNKIL